MGLCGGFLRAQSSPPGPSANALGPNPWPLPESHPISSVYELSCTLSPALEPCVLGPTTPGPALFPGSSGLLPGWH